MPPLEAMQYGLPVISSDYTCLPEILGDGALYFDPTDPAKIAKTAHLVLTDKDTSEKLIKNGKKIIQKYSWHSTVSQTLSVYKKI